MYLSLSRHSCNVQALFAPAQGQHLILVENGAARTSAGDFAQGSGFAIGPGDQVHGVAELLVFSLMPEKPQSALNSHVIETSGPALLRLDEVSFPPGAIAYRHVHPGPGFRFLRCGALSLRADDHSFDVTPGDSWFEPAHSPVRAEASPHHAETRFARAMVLPPEFAGKPTIRILDPEDTQKPRLQTTTRHIEVLIHGDSG